FLLAPFQERGRQRHAELAVVERHRRADAERSPVSIVKVHEHPVLLSEGDAGRGFPSRPGFKIKTRRARPAPPRFLKRPLRTARYLSSSPLFIRCLGIGTVTMNALNSSSIFLRSTPVKALSVAFSQSPPVLSASSIFAGIAWYP